GEVEHSILRLTADDGGLGRSGWLPDDLITLDVEVIVNESGEHVALGQAKPRGHAVKLLRHARRHPRIDRASGLGRHCRSPLSLHGHGPWSGAGLSSFMPEQP